MIVSMPQLLEITEDPNFQEFVKALNPNFKIPSKTVIRSQFRSIYNEEVKKLRSTLACVCDVVLTCELWSSEAEDSYLTVGCHFVDLLGTLRSYTLQTMSLFDGISEANIINQLSAVVEAWSLKEKVHTVVGAGMPTLKNVETKWSHMPCFADTLNVVFKDLMSDGELSDVLRKCQSIISFFTKDSEAEKKLREIQNRLEKEQEELIVSSGDQWLPSLHMLQLLMQQYNSMVMVFDERNKTDLFLTDNDKKKIQNIISALKPVHEATSKMKTDGFQTISAMLPLLRSLFDNLGTESKQNPVAKTLLSKCKKKFGDINNHKLAPITFLDPRYKDQLGEQNQKQAIEKIRKELAAGPASSAGADLKLLDEYKDYECNSESSNPLAWWRLSGGTKFDKLSKLALKKLGVVSTAVPLERAFSSAGDPFSYRRSSIEPQDLDVILFLHSNWSSTGP